MSSFLEIDYVRPVLTLEQAINHRRTERKNRFSFGIQYLDDCLGGFHCNDLVLIGAQTGRGKTHTAVSIAQSLSKAGKKVFYFALEAHQYEIEQRMLYSELIKTSKIEYGKYFRMEDGLDLKDELAAAENLKKSIDGLYLFYKTEDFGPLDLERKLTELQDVADAFIIDHFHFLDYDPNENEHVAHKVAVKRIGHLVRSLHKPVILVAHLNKAYARTDRKLPNEYDFYGTGDLANISTKIVLLSDKVPDSMCDVSPGVVIHTPKNRDDMSVARFFGVLNYSNSGVLNSSYYLGDVRKMDFSVQTPWWAKNRYPLRPYSPR